MSDTPEREGDQEPAPVKESDAETLSGNDGQDEAQDIENDPSRNPSEDELRDVKGG
jgi:hypothetical protein